MKDDYLYFTNPETAHWKSMWAWLSNHPKNAGLAEPTVAECPDTGETWQYMGTEKIEPRVWADCFRHRSHPTTGDRVYLRCRAPSPKKDV